MIKPYRLVNASELSLLKTHVSQVIEDWNEEYALTPWGFELELFDPALSDKIFGVFSNDTSHSISFPTSCDLFAGANEHIQPLNLADTLQDISDSCFSIYGGGEEIARMDLSYTQAFQSVLYGESHSCFHAASQEVAQRLLNRLLQRDDCEIDATHKPPPLSWFYKGSTCLFLILKTECYQIRIILSPHWVYPFLPSTQIITQSLTRLEQALEDEIVDLDLQLETFNLPLEQLMTIKPGDVLVTDHLVELPLQLLHSETCVAHALLSPFDEHVSIQLKRSL